MTMTEPYIPSAAPPAPPPPPPAPQPRRTRLVPLAALGVVTLVAGAAIGFGVSRLPHGSTGSSAGSGSSSSPPSAAAAAAAAIFQQALDATRASGGFHYVAHDDGPGRQTITGDAGLSNGRQDITYESSFGSERFTLLLVRAIVYFQGNAPALQDQLGVPATAAPGLAGKWVSVSDTDGPYGVVQPGITVDDQAQEMVLVPQSTSTVQVGGTRATRITGTIPAAQGAPAAAAHLDVAPDTKRPIAYASTLTVNGVTVHSTSTFSAWGTSPTVTAPTGAVAWATLGASEPPGGYGGGGTGATPSPSPTPQ